MLTKIRETVDALTTKPVQYSLADIRKRFCEEINLQEGTDGWIYNPDEELGERFPICDFRQFNSCLRFVIAEARANRIDAETEI